MPDSCVYDDREYSHGSVVCQNGYEYRCNDGTWDPLGTRCVSTGESSSPNIEIPEDKAKQGKQTQE